jgi:hypothetical protein
MCDQMEMHGMNNIKFKYVSCVFALQNDLKKGDALLRWIFKFTLE